MKELSKLFPIISGFYLFSVLIFFIQQNSKNPVALNFPENHICACIKEIQFQNNKFVFTFNKKYHTKNLHSITSHFTLETNAYGIPISMDDASIFNVTSINEQTIYADYKMPFVYNYSIDVFCDNNYISTVNANLSDFQYNTPGSQAKCYGKTIDDRWCEIINSSLVNGMITLYSKAKFEFKENFLTGTSRSVKKLNYTDILFSVSNLDPDSEVIEYYNNETIHYLFNVGNIFDERSKIDKIINGYIPIRHMVDKIDPDRKHKNVLIPFDTDKDIFFHSISPNTRRKINSDFHLQMERAIVGLENLESAKVKQKFAFPYDSIGPLPRISDNFVQKQVLFINPKETRVFDEDIFINKTKFYCINCSIKTLEYDIDDPSSCIEEVSKAHVVFARTLQGSELVYFMQPGTLLVELLQSNFGCETRTSEMARMIGVNVAVIPNNGYSSNDPCQKASSCFEKKCRESLSEFPYVFPENVPVDVIDAFAHMRL